MGATDRIEQIANALLRFLCRSRAAGSHIRRVHYGKLPASTLAVTVNGDELCQTERIEEREPRTVQYDVAEAPGKPVPQLWHSGGVEPTAPAPHAGATVRHAGGCRSHTDDGALAAATVTRTRCPARTVIRHQLCAT